MKHKILTLLIGVIAWHSQVAAQIVVSTSATWNATNFNSSPPLFGTWNNLTNTLTLTQSVVIDRGLNPGRVTLTISGIIVQFAAATSITVQTNEELIVTGGASLQESSTWWQGINALGDNTEDQFVSGIPEKFEPFNNTTTYNTDQTNVEIASSSIRKAELGVRSVNGAILQLSASTFTDCEVAVRIEDYTHADIGATEMFDRNACFVDECIFESNAVQNFSHSNSDFTNYAMIDLIEVFGVHIQGCSFENTDFTARFCGERGVGVRAEDATFTIHQSGDATLGLDNCVTYDGLPNEFTSLSSGIQCFESVSPTRRSNVAIHACEFTLCENAIHADGNHRVLITSCDVVDLSGVDVYASSSIACAGGYQMVLLENLDEFVLQKNNFSATPLYNHVQPISMVRIDNCGSRDNKIYQNTFINPAPDAPNTTDITGIELMNTNSRIEIWCNEFESCQFGITVANGSTINATWQNDLSGNPAVGNVFTGTDRNKDLNNLSSTTITYHETNGTFPPNITSRWTKFTELAEASCTDFPCDEWPIGVGMSDINTGSANVYPNPVNSSETIIIQMESPLTGTIAIYDVLGRVERTYSSTETMNIEIKDHNLNPGIHFIVIQSATGEKTSLRLIVNE